MGKNARLKKLARHLLATTCLTAGAASLAPAQTVNEGSGLANDFGNSLGTAFQLPSGTTTVNGATGGGFFNGSFVADPADFFTFTGLAAGTGFSFSANVNSTCCQIPPTISLFGDAGADLGSQTFSATTLFGPGTASGSGIVPNSGNLTFEVTANNEGQTGYSVSLSNSVSATPEPGTLGAMGLGLIATGALLRKKKK